MITTSIKIIERAREVTLLASNCKAKMGLPQATVFFLNFDFFLWPFLRRMVCAMKPQIRMCFLRTIGNLDKSKEHSKTCQN